MVASKSDDANGPPRGGGIPEGAIRCTVAQAAVALQVSVDTVRKLLALGDLDNTVPAAERGVGRQAYLAAEQVRAYALGGRDAARRWRDEQAQKRRARR